VTIQGKLYEKLQSEYNSFLGGLRDLPPQQIIEAAHEIVSKECILEVFGERENVSYEQAKELLDNNCTLNTLYATWINSDCSINGLVHYAIDEYMQDLEVQPTYKAELQLPGEEYPHLEVFGADNDVEAIEYAHELCETAEDEVELLEVHELDENYDSIREIDLNSFDPSLRRYMDVDLFDFLGHISDKVIIHYRNDWNIDKEFLLKSAESQDPNDKRIAWHVCATGTHQLNESDVFIKESGAYAYWTDYHQNDPDMFGFFIEITGHENGRVYGNVFEVGDYAKHAQHVRDTALPIDTVTLEYSESWGVNCGLTITVSRKEYDDDRQRLMCDSGNVISVKMNPLEGNFTLADVLKIERAHRMGMPVGDTQEYLQKLETKLFEIRGEPLENAFQLVPKKSDEVPSPANPTKPTTATTTVIIPAKPIKPPTFDEVLKQAQAKADDINRQNALNKGQQPSTTKNNPEIGE